MEKRNGNLMDPAQRLREAPRCHARAKSTGQPCKAPAVKGWAVCRVHGAGGGAPKGKANGQWKHGARATDTDVFRRLSKELLMLSAELRRRMESRK